MLPFHWLAPSGCELQLNEWNSRHGRPSGRCLAFSAAVIMEQLTPQVMHKLVFTILVHGLPDPQMPIAYEVLLEALNHPNPQVRELAVVALAELAVPPLKRVAALARALRDPAARVRRRAARALGDFGTQAAPALPELIAGLKDPDLSVRRDCAGALGRFGPAASPAIPGLVALLSEPETRCRVVAATALKRIGPAAVPALLEKLRQNNPVARPRCIAVLSYLAADDPEVAEALREAEIHEAEDDYHALSATVVCPPMAAAVAS